MLHLNVYQRETKTGDPFIILSSIRKSLRQIFTLTKTVVSKATNILETGQKVAISGQIPFNQRSVTFQG